MPESQEIAVFLSSYPEEVRATALAARRFLKGTLPGAKESIDAPAKLIGYSYGAGYKGLVCTLIMSRTGVKLGIVRGAELADPKRLMTGAGKVHRHVPLKSPADLDRPGLTQLIEDALAAWKARRTASSPFVGAERDT